MAQITGAISFSKVNSALGASHTDLAALCKDQFINMWAKYKPVVWASINTLGALNGSVWNPSCASNLQWWKGTNGDYGLSYSGAMVSVSVGSGGMVTALNSLATLINGSANGWTYTKPSGGSSSPYRLTDFLQYNHSVGRPFQNVSISDVYASSASGYTVTMGVRRSEPSDISARDYVVPEDITTYSLHIGIAIFKKSGSTYSAIAWATNDNLEWNGAGIVNSDASDGIISQTDAQARARLKDTGVYYVLPFYATASLPQPADEYSANASTSNVKLITAPYTTFASFTAHQRSSTQTIGKPEISDNTISMLGKINTTLYLNAAAGGYSGGTASTVRLAIVNELWNGTSASGNYDYDNTWTNVVVANNTRVTVGSTGQRTLDLTHTWRIIVEVNGERTTFGTVAPPPLGQ